MFTGGVEMGDYTVVVNDSDRFFFDLNVTRSYSSEPP